MRSSFSGFQPPGASRRGAGQAVQPGGEVGNGGIGGFAHGFGAAGGVGRGGGALDGEGALAQQALAGARGDEGGANLDEKYK